MAKISSKLQKQFLDLNLCDDRGAVFAATAGRLPNGNFGVVWLSVKGNDLHISACVGIKSDLGELQCTIPLREVKNFQSTNGFFGEVLKGYSFRFVYGGHKFMFKNCFPQKNALAVIRQEASKQG